jgi:glycosyltransferase involved in cell wall biosynthesis
MKIAMIGHKRIPSREGGVEIVVEELSTRLVEQGHEVDVYNRKGKNVQDKNADIDKQKIKEYKGTKIITIPTINKKGIDALLYSFFASIRAILKKYDVLHYHAEGSCAMLWIPHLIRKKIVVTIHGLDWQRSKWGGFATKYIKFGEKLAAKYADEIIVLSKGVQEYFKNTYNRDTHFIPNGVNKPVKREAKIIKEKYGLNKNDYILFLARLVPEKGLHYLIQAYKQINTDKKLVIAGGASHTNDYLEKIRNMVKDDKRIIMTGFVQGEELEELFGNCCIYCLPSDVEGMPISLLEAMSYGCNCLVSNIEENVQVCKEYAITFEKGNIDDLKIKLEKCLHQIKRKS